MTNTDDIRAKLPCSLYKIFCITNQIQCAESIEPWYGQIKEFADGANKWSSEMHNAVIFGMYPELEKASKEFGRRYRNIYNEFANNPNKDRESLIKSTKELSIQIGEQYKLNENKYLFNKMTEEQAQRVQKRKDIELKNMCNNKAEEFIDPLHIVMQGLCKKVSPNDCKKLMTDFGCAEKFFNSAHNNKLELVELAREKFPEAYSIYKQVEKCLETAEIKDCYQVIDGKNYAKFTKTLGNIKYKGKEYNLQNVVTPITQKRDIMGDIIEIRSNASSLQPQKIL